MLLLPSLSLLLLALPACLCSSASRPRSCLLFGPTSAGKSSFLNTLKGREVARVQPLSASSSMKCQDVGYCSPSLANEQPIIFIDTPGLTGRPDGDGEVMMKIKQCLNQEQTTGMPFNLSFVIVFESLQSPTMQLPHTLQALHSLFPPGNAPPVVVLMTKTDVRPSTYKRAQEISACCLEYAVPCIAWDNCESLWVEPKIHVGPLNVELLAYQMSELNRLLTPIF